MHLVLLEDVNGLGITGDIVLADRSYARNYLVPFKKAYYVPMFLGKPILPDGWVKPVTADLEYAELITPAIVNVPYSENDSAEPGVKEILSTEELKQKLESVGLLEFSRVLIQADSDKIFGSVSGMDISQLLKSQFGLEVGIETRLKTIGKHQVNVSVGDDTVTLDILISPQQ